MTTIFFNTTPPPPPLLLPSLPPSSSSTFSVADSNSFTRLHKKSICLNQKLLNGIQVHKPIKLKERYAVIVKVSSDGTDPVLEPPSESDDESAALEDLHLEPKLQLKLEQKMKMKISKKIRLRRKKLLRKRGMRKKGRWPPAKMNKNNNI